MDKRRLEYACTITGVNVSTRIHTLGSMSGTVPKLVITEIRMELVYFSFDKLSSS